MHEEPGAGFSRNPIWRRLSTTEIPVFDRQRRSRSKPRVASLASAPWVTADIHNLTPKGVTSLKPTSTPCSTRPIFGQNQIAPRDRSASSRTVEERCNPFGQRRKEIFVEKNSCHRGKWLRNMLSTDPASVEAATFKLILLVNHPIELVFSSSIVAPTDSGSVESLP